MHTHVFWKALFFGPFYFGYHKKWKHVVISCILAIMTGGISQFIYPFFAKRIMAA